MRSMFGNDGYDYNDKYYLAQKMKEAELKRLKQEGIDNAIELKTLSLEETNLTTQANLNQHYRK